MFECLSELLLNVVCPVVLLIEVLVLHLPILLHWGIDEFFVKHHHAAFAHCLQDDVTLTRFLGLPSDILEGLELHVIHLDLLGEFENHRLI